MYDPARVFTANGQSWSEGDRMELARLLGAMVAQLQPAPCAQDWLQVMRDAEAAEHSRWGTDSAVFRHKAAKAILTEHVVLLALHHGVLLASNNYVLLHAAGDRSAESLITRGVTDLSLSVPDPGASSGATTPASTSPGDAAAPAATTGASAHDIGSMVEGAGDQALVDLPLKQHVNHQVCHAEQGQDATFLS